MLRKFFKLTLAISLLCAVVPFAITFADASIKATKESLANSEKTKDIKIKKEVTLPEVTVAPGDTVITVTKKGILRDITYTIPVTVEK